MDRRRLLVDLWSLPIGLVAWAGIWVVSCDDAASPGVRAPADAGPEGPTDALRPLDACVPVPEICNGLDDDCDGRIDELDPELRRRLQADPEHCGACGNPCEAPFALTECRGGLCHVAGCEPGREDLNGRYEDGCEADCLISAGGREICDGLDNDCDGLIDEDFDLDTDPLHCGACGEVCAPAAGGQVACVDGACALTACDPGQVNLDQDATTGCEYACSPTSTPQVREFCNGLDDDCDGLIDEAADLLSPSFDCGALGVCAPECAADADCPEGERCSEGRVCLPRAGLPRDTPCEADAECQALHPGYACLTVPVSETTPPVLGKRCVPRRHGPQCDGIDGFRCVRPLGWQRGDEAGACDGLDNDCDGRVDEDFADALLVAGLGSEPRTCEAGLGACRAEGVAACTPDGLNAACLVEAALPLGPDDNCDGVDDDCDGLIDEAFVDAWVAIGDFEIYAHEASRPGATAVRPGLDPTPRDGPPRWLENRPCSRPGVLPWANVDAASAEAACARVGARLCTDAEWSRACAGAAGQRYPYGPNYQLQSCNSGERDADPGRPGLVDAPLPTGSLPNCVRDGVFDLSGNVKEWTAEARDGLRMVRGGGYETAVPDALACDERADLKPPALGDPAIGFRCCRAR